MSLDDSQAVTRIAITFKCPHCSTDVTSDPSLSGLESICPNCTQRIVVPPSDYVEPNTARVAQAMAEVFPDPSSGLTISAFMASRNMEDRRIELEDKTASEEAVVYMPPKPRSKDFLETEHHKRYEIGKVIAQGGMGAIIDSRDMNIRRHVAMKVMLQKQDKKHSNAELLRFIEEAQVTGQLEHPNIVPVHELGVDAEGHVFYTMKLIRGTTLKDIIKDIRAGKEEIIEKYPLNHLINIYLKLCDAMAFAHARGVVHRDLKPENVMVGDYGEVLVLDWGLAKIIGVDDSHLREEGDDEKPDWITEDVDSLRQQQESLKTMKGTILGTPSFMAPEQAHGKTDSITAKADVYALGGILYNLLTLHMAIETRTMNELLMKLVSGKIVPPQDWNPDGRKTKDEPDGEKTVLHHLPNKQIPNSLAAVALKAMSLREEDRYESVKTLQAEIEAWQAGFATQAEAASLLTQLRLLVTRHKREFILAGIAVAILLVGGTAFTVSLKLSRDEALRQRNEKEIARKEAVDLSEKLDVEKAVAVKAKNQAERELYHSNIQFAYDCIYGTPARPATAQKTLLSCRADLRDFEWGVLQEKLNALGNIHDISGWREPSSWSKRTCVTRDARTIYLLGQVGTSVPKSNLFVYKRNAEGWARSVVALEDPTAYDLALDRHEKYLAVKGHRTFILDCRQLKPVISFESKGLGPISFIDSKAGVLCFGPSSMSNGHHGSALLTLQGKTIARLDGEAMNAAPEDSASTAYIAYTYQKTTSPRIHIRNRDGKDVWTIPGVSGEYNHAMESIDGAHVVVLSEGGVRLVNRSSKAGSEFASPSPLALGNVLRSAVVQYLPVTGRLFISPGGNCSKSYLFDTKAVKLLATYSFSCTALVYDKSQTRIAVADRNLLHLVSVGTGTVVSSTRGHDSNINALRLSADGSRIISVSSNRILTSQIMREQTGLQGLVTNTGNLIIPGDKKPILNFVRADLPRTWFPADDRGSVVVLGRRLRIIGASGEERLNMDLLPELKQPNRARHILQTPSGRGLLITYRDSKRKMKLALYELKTRKHVWTIDVATRPTLRGLLTKDDKLFFNQQVIDIYNPKSVRAIGHCVSGQARLFVHGPYHVAVAGSSYRLLDNRSKQRILMFSANMTAANYSGMTTVLPEQKMAAFVVSNNEVAVYDLNSRKRIQHLQGNRSPFKAIRLLPGGKRLISMDLDSALKIWDLKTGREILMMELPSHFNQCDIALSADNQKLIVSNNLGHQYLVKAAAWQ